MGGEYHRNYIKSNDSTSIFKSKTFYCVSSFRCAERNFALENASMVCQEKKKQKRKEKIPQMEWKRFEEDEEEDEERQAIKNLLPGREFPPQHFFIAAFGF